MGTKMISGTDLHQAGAIIMEHFSPGQSVEMLIGVLKPLNPDELDKMAHELSAGGLKLQGLEYGSTHEWPDAIRLTFTRPSLKKGEIGILPLIVLIIGALGIVGIGAVLGFKIGGVMDSIGRNLMPIALVAGGVFILYAVISKPSGAK